METYLPLTIDRPSTLHPESRNAATVFANKNKKSKEKLCTKRRPMKKELLRKLKQTMITTRKDTSVGQNSTNFKLNSMFVHQTSG